MNKKPSPEIISEVMKYIGGHTSEKKKIASRKNGKEHGGRKPICNHDFREGSRGGKRCTICNAYECRKLSARRYHLKVKIRKANAISNQE